MTVSQQPQPEENVQQQDSQADPAPPKKPKSSPLFLILEIGAVVLAIGLVAGVYMMKKLDKAVSSFDTSLRSTIDNTATENVETPLNLVVKKPGLDALDSYEKQVSKIKDSKLRFSDQVWDQFASSNAINQLEYIVPPEKRWRFALDEDLTLGAYAQQLDGLGIELGVIENAGTITYLTQLSKPKPVSRKGPVASEKRIYFTWFRGDLVEADRALLAGANIDAAGLIVLHFLSPAADKALKDLETKARGASPLSTILETRFGVKLGNKGYEFFVVGQKRRE